MLTNKELEEIREILEKSNDPLYLFDDDGDGICSYLVLKNHYKKGRGNPIKNSGPLDNFYLDYMEEGKPDLIIILDKAVVKQSFIDETPCTVLYLDHHPLQNLKKVKYFNPLKHDKDVYLPTSYLAYQVTKDSLWLATLGCLFDYHIPDFIKDFKKEYPDLIEKIPTDPGYVLFKTELGKLIRIFTFNLKGRKSEVKKSIKALEKIKSPHEILNKTTEDGKYLYGRYEKLNKEYERLIEDSKKEITKDEILLFIYPSTKISFTNDLATELSYYHQDKTVIIGREKGDEFKISLRNQKKNIREALAKALEGIRGYGGGHKNACGANIKSEDFNKFIDNFKKYLE